MRKTIISINGMACSMCEAHINDAIRREFQVKKVTSSHTKKQTEVISEADLEEAKVKKVIEETGYTFLGMTSEPYVKKGFFSFGK
ncbi:MAG: heavy-metal-associated domain-containing protein [Roseburia sp.]